MKKYICYLAVLLSGLYVPAHAQELKPADDVANILGDQNNKISKATVQTETEKTVGIQIEYVGFKDKTYTVKATMLNSAKRPVKEIDPVEVNLDSRSKMADLFFTFKQQAGKQYDKPHLETAFVKFSVLEKKSGDSSGFDLGGSLGDLGIGTKEFTFVYKKKWKLRGVAGQEITVKLTPFKSAASIKQ